MKYLQLPLFAAILITGCSTETTPIYTLATEISPSEAGSVSPSSGEFDEGTEVEVTVIANDHWVFAGWQGDQSGSQNPVTIIMNGDKSVTALFEKIEYALNVETEGEGSVTEQVITAKTDYEHDTTVELTAEPDDEWSFVEWTNDLTGSENPATITVDGDKDVTAVFKINEYDLDISTDGEGSVSLSPDKDLYEYGEDVELSASPVEHWQFVEWTGGLESDDNPVTTTIEGTTNITAVFEEIEPELQLWDCQRDEECTDPKQVSFPYESSGSSMIFSLPPPEHHIHRVFFLRAIHDSYEVRDLSAEDNNEVTEAFFEGLEDGDVIEPGIDMQFSLQSGRTHDDEAELVYQFNTEAGSFKLVRVFQSN